MHARVGAELATLVAPYRLALSDARVRSDASSNGVAR